MNLLSRKEIKRYHLINPSQIKMRFLVSHIALRQILSFYLKIPPQDVRIKFGEFGKPRIKKSSSLFFNMSHTKNLTLVAVSDSEVGIDTEFVKANFAYEDIIKDNFSEFEILQIQKAASCREKTFLFYNFWTKKEAILKFLGLGIIDDLRDVNDKFVQLRCNQNVFVETQQFANCFIMTCVYKKTKDDSLYIKNFNFDGAYG